MLNLVNGLKITPTNLQGNKQSLSTKDKSMAYKQNLNVTFKKYLPFEQDGKTYNLYDLPKGFVIEGSLNLSCKDLLELPDLSDVVIKGNFYCYGNKLTSLKGAPKEVGKSFDCSNNGLTSLIGAPKVVGGYFECSRNQLTSLEGAPQNVGEDFKCDYNGLTSLKGAPQKVGGSFICYNNKLTSLDGAPEEVGGNFCCQYNQLTSLEGAPIVVDGGFDCYHNQLTSLVGVSRLKESEKIYCDDSLGAKYGFSNAENYGIKYEKLCNSPLYKSEAAMSRVRSKQQQEQKAKQQEKINAEFSQWLKDNSNKPTRE